MALDPAFDYRGVIAQNLSHFCARRARVTEGDAAGGRSLRGTASDILSTPAGFRATWDRIRPARRTPMQHAIWIEACFDVFYESGRMDVVVADGDPPCAAAAFARRGAFPQRLFLAGAEELWEPIDVVYSDPHSAAALVENVLSRRKPLRFGHFPTDSAFGDALARGASRFGILLAAPVAASPYIALDDGWKTPEQRFSSGRRSDLRRMARKAGDMGAATYEILAPRPDETGALLDAAVAVEAKSWKARSKTALAFDAAQEAFFRRYAWLAAENGILRISLMKIGGEIAAVQLAVECDDAFWLFKIGYDERFAACSPGNLLMLESIRYAANQGLSSFEFLGKAAPWTRVWTEAERPNQRLRFYPHTPEGYVALAEDAIAAGSRRLVERARNAFKAKEG